MTLEEAENLKIGDKVYEIDSYFYDYDNDYEKYDVNESYSSINIFVVTSIEKNKNALNETHYNINALRFENNNKDQEGVYEFHYTEVYASLPEAYAEVERQYKNQIDDCISSYNEEINTIKRKMMKFYTKFYKVLHPDDKQKSSLKT